MKTQKEIKYPNDLKNVKSEYEHNEACQVVLFLSGKTSKDIKERLLSIIKDIDEHDYIPQGILCGGNSVAEIIRPRWREMFNL